MNCNRLVISGASGFLGKNIIQKALEAKDLKVLAITSRPESFDGIDKSKVSTINTEDFLKNGYEASDNDVFINCLFPTNADGFRMADGLAKVYRIIEIARKSGVKKFINISSQSVYDSKRTYAASEDSQICLETPYAVGKYSTEELTNVVFSDVLHTNIRLASLIGVGYGQRIINRMAVQSLKGERLSVIGGKQRYGFLDVRDAADGILKLALGSSDSWENEYNLGTDRSYSLMDIAELVVNTVNSKSDVNTGIDVTEGSDLRNSALDAGRFMTAFDWHPTISIEQTANEIVEELISSQGN